MKVGTDAMLLGAWTDVSNCRYVLDVGTGCGILALMTAQKSEGMVHALDIHLSSSVEAYLNFASSPWSQRLLSIHCDLMQYKSQSKLKYDALITNPPYFKQSLLPSTESRKLARHSTRPGFHLFIEACHGLMHSESRLSVILPSVESPVFEQSCNARGLFARRQLLIRPSTTGPVILTLSEYSFKQGPLSESELSIRDEHGNFSASYLALTENFHYFGENR
jgi:tRNA1Val (adenine37-N6)-methyltransferase